MCSYGYKLVCTVDDRFSKPVQLYRGENAAHKFLEDMILEEAYGAKIIKNNFYIPKIMTEQDRSDFSNAKFCRVCKVEYKVSEEKVRDHDHRTGKYKGSAHQSCQSKIYYEKSLNAFFHNLKGYDSYFLIQELGKFKGRKSIIPNNTEKFLSLVSIISNSKTQINF